MAAEGATVHTAPVLHTGDGGRLEDAAVAVRAGRVLEVGPRAAVLDAAPGAEVIAHAGCILPGFVDAHVHLLRSARDLAAVDCRPPAVATIGQLLAAVRGGADRLGPDAWVDAAGYHEADLAERRHPTAAELDRAARGRPVRLRHRSGHGAVLSTAALLRLGIGPATPDPPGGRIERDGEGVPTGMLYGTAVRLARRAHDPADTARLLARLSRAWLERGITSVCDAGPENDLAHLEAVRDFAASGSLGLRVVVMRGAADALADLRPWPSPSPPDGMVRAGHVKYMIRHAHGLPSPTPEQVVEDVVRLAGAGFGVAIHAAGLEAVTAAVSAVEAAGPRPAGSPPHRIEHCTLLPDPLLERLRRSGAAGVSHPLFVERHGDRYLLDPVEHPPQWLYRIGSLVAAGVPVAAGSDAPVTPPAPLESIAAAMRRRTGRGVVIGAAETVDLATAIRLHTAAAADVCGCPDLGRLRPGGRADLVVVGADPVGLAPAEIAALPVLATVVGGGPVAAACQPPAPEFVPCSP